MNDLISKINSDRFGIKVAKVNDPKIISISKLTQIKQEGVKLVISRLSSEKIVLIYQMEEWGYRVTCPIKLQIKNRTLLIFEKSKEQFFQN